MCEHLQALYSGQVGELLGRAGEGPQGQVAQAVVALQDGLCSQRGAGIQQLVGDHGSEGSLGWVGRGTAVVLGVRPLVGPYCLCHLGHHGQDPGRQLLMTQKRQTELVFLGTCGIVGNDNVLQHALKNCSVQSVKAVIGQYCFQL